MSRSDLIELANLGDGFSTTLLLLSCKCPAGINLRSVAWIVEFKGSEQGHARVTEYGHDRHMFADRFVNKL
jgi:hypothetical protein